MKVLLCVLILCIFTAGFVLAEENTTTVIAKEKVIAVEEVTANVTNETEQVVLFEGNITLPEGNVSAKASSGKSYEFPALTPMGALLTAAPDANLSLVISDKPMAHKGILAIDGINNYTYTANNTWFVVVNDYQLQEYVTPATDGMNVYSIKPGDKLAFYYGLPIKPAADAQATVLLTIK